MAFEHGHNCSFAAQNRTIQPLQDIAGPGVVVSFMISLWLVVAGLVIHYLSGSDLEGDALQDSDSSRPWAANPIDVKAKLFTQSTLSRFSSSPVSLAPWHKALREKQAVFVGTVVDLCTMSTITGLANLIASFAVLKSNISAYDFQLAVYAVWFIAIVQVASFKIQLRHLRHRPAVRGLRIALIWFLLFLLELAMIPTMFFNWTNDRQNSISSPGSYAICYLNISRSVSWCKDIFDMNVQETSAFQSTIMSMLLVLLSMFIQVAKTHECLSNLARAIRSWLSSVFTAAISYVLANPHRTSGIRHVSVRRSVFYLLMPHLLVFRVLADLLTSSLSDAYWLLVAAVWGTIKFFLARASVDAGNGAWTYGQILTVLALLGPLCNVIEKMLTSEKPLPLPQGDLIPLQARGGQVDRAGTHDHAELPSPAGSSGREISCPAEHPDEMTLLRQLVTHTLNRDVYNTQAYPWFVPTITFSCLHIVAITAQVLLDLKLNKSSAVEGISNFASLIFLLTPTSCYLSMLVGHVFENAISMRGRVWMNWAVCAMLIIFFSLYPVWTGSLNPHEPFHNVCTESLYIYFCIAIYGGLGFLLPCAVLVMLAIPAS